VLQRALSTPELIVNALFEAAGYGGDRQPESRIHLEPFGEILIYSLMDISVPPMPTGIPADEEWVFQGYHGTSCSNCIGVLESGVLEGRSWKPPGLLFVRGGSASNHQFHRAQWLKQVFESSMGSDGIAIEVECRTASDRVALPLRNDPDGLSGHDAELRESMRGLATKYCTKRPARWTFPQNFTAIRRLMIASSLLRRAGFQQALQLRGL
jgi:hypothetical protein